MGFSLVHAVPSADISRRPYNLEDARAMVRRLAPSRTEQLRLADYLIGQLEQDLSPRPRHPCEILSELLLRRHYILVRRRASPRVPDEPSIRPLVEP